MEVKKNYVSCEAQLVGNKVVSEIEVMLSRLKSSISQNKELTRLIKSSSNKLKRFNESEDVADPDELRPYVEEDVMYLLKESVQELDSNNYNLGVIAEHLQNIVG